MSLCKFNFSKRNASFNNASSSKKKKKKKKEKKLDGRCFCGLEVALMESGTMTNPNRWFIRYPLWKTRDCKYFVWVDKIEEGWKGLAKSLVKRNMDISHARQEDGLTITAGGRENHEVLSMMTKKMEKVKAEVKRSRLLLATMALGVMFCVACNLYLVIKI